MPQVPYSPLTEVKPQGAPGAFMSINPDTGAQLIGQATSGLGKTLGMVSDRQEEIDIKLATINNDTEANKIEAATAMKMTDIRAQYQARPQDDAVSNFDGTKKDLQTLYDETINGIKNPAVKQQVQKMLLTRLAREYDMVGSHYAQETRKANVNSRTAVSNVAALDAINAKSDDDFEESYGDSLHMAEEASRAAGQSDPAQLRMAKQVASDGIITKRLSGISMDDPTRAQSLLEQYSDRLSPAAQQQLEKTIRNDITRVETKRVGDDIVNGSTGYSDYERRLFNAESGGDPSIKSKTSSATGLGQITKGTWADIKKAHPELELDDFATGVKDPEQNAKATRAFTLDNAKALTDADISPTQKNLRMTHFLGRNGGPAFISAMESDPTANAAKMFPDAAGANRSVFYKPNGDARTLKEVYNLQTQKFSNSTLGGPDDVALKPLTPNSTQSEINQMATEARARFEGNIEAQDKAEAYVRQRAANVLAQAKDIQKQNFAMVSKGLIGQDGKAPTSLDELLANPSMRDAYYAMDLDQQNRVDRALTYNAGRNTKTDPEVTPERLARFKELRGLAATDPEKFGKLVLPGEDLPRAWLGRLYEIQTKPPKEDDSEWGLTSVLGKLSGFGVPQALKLDKKKNPKLYNEYVGAVQSRIEEAKEKGEVWDENRIRQLGLDLAKKTTVPREGIGGFFGMTKDVPAFTVPRPQSDNRDPRMKDISDTVITAVTREFASKNGGRAPTADQFMTIYNNPANREKLDQLGKAK